MGQIEYFNKALARYRITSADDSENFVSIDEIDEMEKRLLE